MRANVLTQANQLHESKELSRQEEVEPTDLQRVIAILLQVGERPMTTGELGLTRQDALKLVRTGYFEWKRVLFPSERGREVFKWLLRVRKEDELTFFEMIKEEALRMLAQSGNKVTASIKMLQPIHIHVMRKIKNGLPVFYADAEKRALKELIRWELAKKFSIYGIPDLTRLGREVLKYFEEASRNASPAPRFNGGDEAGVERT